MSLINFGDSCFALRFLLSHNRSSIFSGKLGYVELVTVSSCIYTVFPLIVKQSLKKSVTQMEKRQPSHKTLSSSRERREWDENILVHIYSWFRNLVGPYKAKTIFWSVSLINGILFYYQRIRKCYVLPLPLIYKKAIQLLRHWWVKAIRIEVII